jgi:hypothetical protein
MKSLARLSAGAGTAIPAWRTAFKSAVVKSLRAVWIFAGFRVIDDGITAKFLYHHT